MSRSVRMALILALAGAGGAWWYADRAPAGITSITPAQAQESSATPSSTVERVPDMILGKADAPLTVVEYASFTCPHCANFHAAVWDQFKTNYIDTGKVKFVYREVYFDKFGLWAAMVARCGGPEKYFGIADMLYDGQREWLASGEEAGIGDELRKIGLKAGMAEDQVNACLNDKDQAQAMVSVYQANAEKDKVQGTPTFLIGGESRSGAMSYEEFAKLLDAKLAQ